MCFVTFSSRADLKTPTKIFKEKRSDITVKYNKDGPYKPYQKNWMINWNAATSDPNWNAGSSDPSAITKEKKSFTTRLAS